jgi:hypothetical protein
MVAKAADTPETVEHEMELGHIEVLLYSGCTVGTLLQIAGNNRNAEWHRDYSRAEKKYVEEWDAGGGEVEE